MRLRSALLAVPAPREPTLAEFERFHAMLPRPGVARRCVAAFQNTILFAPSSYTDEDDFPTRGDSRYEVKRLTVFTYWLLVLASFTGLSTMLGRTDVLDAREVDVINEKEVDDVLPPHALHPSEAMMTYVRRKAGERVRPCRRFEFNFRLAGLAVVMLHFRGETTGRLHLVEIYHSRWPAPIRWLFETSKALVAGLFSPRRRHAE
jgi:hypothetical protein